jgi:lysophospholipid acyltransferase (LPLAT)-like uncharacterized protein
MLFRSATRAVDLKWRLIGLGGKLLIDMIFAGSKITFRNAESIAALESSRKCIYVFWHSRILLLSYLYKQSGAAIMVSKSADGEIIAQILQRQGQLTVRGSTRKGGLLALARQITVMHNETRPGVVVPDGPQGPRHRVQPGVILLAQKTGCPIIPVTYSAKRRKIFNSWDRFVLPWPATPCIVIYGRPVNVPSKLDVTSFNACTQELESELNRITADADRCFGHHFEVK